MVDLFEPSLRVEQGTGEVRTLHATTPTPNSCYSAGEARMQDTPPDGRLGIPEARYVTLPLRYSEGPCAQAITTVHHRVRVPDSPGQNFINATVTLEGKELGSATIQLPEPDDSSDGRDLIDIGDVIAWVDTQPPEDPTLHVEATVTVPHTGYRVTLEPSDEVTAEPIDDITLEPSDDVTEESREDVAEESREDVTEESREDARQNDEYHLRLTVTESDGPALQVVRKRSVRFEQTGVTPEIVVIHTPDRSTIRTEVIRIR